ncbi:MAG: sodium:solute symporter [Synoicihabitans sp.]
MQTLDWIVLAGYLGAMIALSAWLSRGQENSADYFVGGRKLPWWAVGISIVATQSSAISFVSIPAFVALRKGGGLTWLQYELAVPLAMLFLLGWVVPYLRDRELVSVFEFPQQRFGLATGRTLAAVFLVSRGLATGIAIYAAALVVSPMLGWSLTASILLIGIVAVIYDTLGGMKAVVASDVIQLGLMVFGVGCAIVMAWSLVGGPAEAWATLAPERRIAVDWSTGLGDEATAPFWAYLVGGLFLYASYYGTDQSQVQRLLGTSRSREAQKAVLLGGVLRLPLTLLYIMLGIALGAVWQTQPELQGLVSMERVDALVPQFLLTYVPVGLKGLILAAILAAAMSSVDSALNSLSAVTLRDFVQPWAGKAVGDHPLAGRIITVVWGVLVTGLALVADGLDRTVIEAINKVGSAFFGPVLATFVIGLSVRRVRGPAMLTGLLSGVAINLTAWLTAWPLHWMWWNVMGFGVATVVAVGLSWRTNAGAVHDLPVAKWRAGEVKAAMPLLLGGFVLTLLLVVLLD